MDKLSWYKWDVEKANIYKKTITAEQMGILFFAVMEYADTGEKATVPDNLILEYKTLCVEIDKCKEAYKKRCETNAKNGAKGGKAKALNASKSNKTSSEAKPPTKTYFKSMVKHLAQTEHDFIQFDDCMLEDSYTKFNRLGWKLFGVEINMERKHELETAICADFLDESYEEEYTQAIYKIIKQKGKIPNMETVYSVIDLMNNKSYSLDKAIEKEYEEYEDDEDDNDSA